MPAPASLARALSVCLRGLRLVALKGVTLSEGRRLPSPERGGPDPGSYHHERHAMGGKRGGAHSPAFADRSSRFKSDKSEAPAARAYYPRHSPGPARSGVGKSTLRRQGGFGSSSARNLELESKERVPGPGAYEEPLRPRTNEKCCASSFASQSKRMSYVPAAVAPPPGTYDAQQDTMAMAAKRGNNRSARSFGSTSKRKLSATPREVEEVPGPGAYEQENLAFPASRERMKPSAAFAPGSIGRDSFLQV
ncbi:MAG: hypothetical protein SGPRY_000633 [Prymnesium sp.]